jgi:hypothetical protein
MAPKRPGSNPSHNPEGEGRVVRDTPTPGPGQSAGSVAAPPGRSLRVFIPNLRDPIDPLSLLRAALRLNSLPGDIGLLYELYREMPMVFVWLAKPDGVATTPPQPGSDPAGETDLVVSRSDLKPRWNKELDILYFDNKPARNVARRAVNLRKVLDAFEARGWPYEIEDPLADVKAPSKNVTRLHETIDTLNQRLKYIKFHSNGSGDGFRWVQVTQRTP